MEGYQNVVTDSKYCFKEVKRKKSWTESRHECENTHGDLATFHSESEHEYLVSKNNRNFWFGYRRSHGGKDVVDINCNNPTFI